MKVLVTGAAGRLGRTTCEQLLHSGYDVLGTDRRYRRDLPCPIELCELDVLNVYKLCRDVDAVVHLANFASSGDPNFTATLTDNLLVNANIFHVAAEMGVKKVIFASSVQVINGTRYGGQIDEPSQLPYLPADGDMAPNPGNPYGLSKQVSETMLQHYVKHHDMAGIALRFPFLLAPHSRRRRRFRMERPVPEEYLRHWSHLDELFACLTTPDAARLIDACLRADLPGYRCYFPAAAYNMTGWEADQLIERLYATVPLRKPVDQLTSLVDISRITEETGWAPQDPFPTPDDDDENAKKDSAK